MNKIYFPNDVLPDIIGKMNDQLFTERNLPIEYIGTCELCAVATAVGNNVRIVTQNDMTIKPNMFIGLVGQPGSMKTPVLNMVFKAIYSHDRAAIQRYNAEIEQYRRKIRVMSEDLEIPQKPTSKQYIVRDATTEGILKLHAGNPHGICVLRDELNAVFAASNQYKKGGADEEFFLEAWSGADIVSNRASKDEIFIAIDPCISIIGGIQPEILISSFRGKRQSNGYLDRFLFSISNHDGEPALWNPENDYDPFVGGEWFKILENILARYSDNNYSEGEYRQLSFSPDAWKAICVWQNKVEFKYPHPPEHNIVRKNEIYAVKFSIIIHILKEETSGRSDDNMVDINTVGRATKLADYFLETSIEILRLIEFGGQDRHRFYDVLGQLDNDFTTAQAVGVSEAMNISRASVYNYLKQFVNDHILERKGQGRYAKTIR